MRCPLQTGHEELLLDYVAQRRNELLSNQLQLHLEQCAECRHFVEEQAKLWTVLEQWEPAEVSPEFDKRLIARIEAEKNKTIWQRWFEQLKLVLVKPALAAGVAIALLLGVVYFSRTPGEPVAGRQEVAVKNGSTENVDVEQLEQFLRDVEMLKELNELAKVEPTAL